MPEPVPSVSRYVLIKRGPDKPLDKLVKLKQGVGVRATAFATADSDFTHFLALEGGSHAEVIAMQKALPAAPTQTMSLKSCTTPNCIDLLAMMKVLTRPSWMPPFEVTVFVVIEFEIVISKKMPPKIELSCEGRAGIVNAGGNRMLLELGSRSGAKVRSDLEKLGAWKGAKKISVLHTGSAAMHRVLP